MAASGNSQTIRLRGVAQNNLKSIDLDLPVGKLIVVTGLSGAGKSSLVFETLHAEGQRRYAETFSPYVRQFLDMLDRPKVESVANIRPSIAIEQGNSVKTSRSTVGTMTELCDFFKVWFAHVAQLFDPETGEEITDDNANSIWHKCLHQFAEQTVCVAFAIHRHGKLTWSEILRPLRAQGYERAVFAGRLQRIDKLQPFLESAPPPEDEDTLLVVQDRLEIQPEAAARFIESATTALHFGNGCLHILSPDGQPLRQFSEGLHRPGSSKRFRPATPALFSFNSAAGACPQCRGFGRIIEIDDRLIIPDESLSLHDGAIRPFSGAVYSESQRDLLAACKRHAIPIHTPWRELTADQRAFVMQGDPDYVYEKGGGNSGWYGVQRFFKWLEENTYKMHVRVFLSRYRAYITCPSCHGSRLQPESLCWKWRGHTLPDLYRLPIHDLLPLMASAGRNADAQAGDERAVQAWQAILTRLGYLDAVGLSYLSLDRSSRTLSGGETQRVNLTSCLGTALVDTLFIMDEPSVGLHQRDIGRLIGILRQLANAGNTVVVVEHDEAIMRAADHIVEVGPKPGRAGGEIVFAGTVAKMLRSKQSLTGAYLSGRKTISRRSAPRPCGDPNPHLRLSGICQHNLRDLDVAIPLGRFVVISGVSGSGKSTLMHNAIYAGLMARSGKTVDNPAAIRTIESDRGFAEILRVDQSPLARTPRSNPVLFVGAWDGIRQLFGQTPAARESGYTAAHFSFNSGHGRCPHCQGLGFERVEMQFMADVFVRCPVCDGKQFRQEILAVRWQGLSIADLLQLTVSAADAVFAKQPAIRHRLHALLDVGLGYLTLGQPLNTLSGGESQRLKLIRLLSNAEPAGKPAKSRKSAAASHGERASALLLLDEPTTGLHRADIERLLEVLDRLVAAGHSLCVIEHQADVIAAADWLIELGPEAGERGGKIVYAGPPMDAVTGVINEKGSPYPQPQPSPAPSVRLPGNAEETLILQGARENNLRNISVTIPRNAMTVVTGLSGSGKSTLAFDIIFAEGQRRYMESMSSWARQYVEQLPKPDIDSLTGISPTVAIEQRVTQGSAKSTVATITEVAQYLRLLYARIGIQYSPNTGEPLVTLKPDAVPAYMATYLRQLPARQRKARWQILVQSIRNRKGHHEPFANWARDHGFRLLRIDGQWVPLDKFKRLDRFKEHTIDLVFGSVQLVDGQIHCRDARDQPCDLNQLVSAALQMGRGALLLAPNDSDLSVWFSTKRTDPVTGEAFPDLDPKDFSWNSPRGWCPTCHGYGQLHDWMREDEKFDQLPAKFSHGDICPACDGQRLNRVSRQVYLHDSTGRPHNLPMLLQLPAKPLLEVLNSLDLDARGQQIFAEVLPEIRERLRFLDEVGLSYLSLDRSANTLSGGEAQRIRLAAQLGSNLTGTLYVLDEPSIGLHERDNERLLHSLQRLKDKGNTLLVVEHDSRTMQAADHIIDLGPRAGRHGGEVMAAGNLQSILRCHDSLTARYLNTGIAHPSRGQFRPLPPPVGKRFSPTNATHWMRLDNPCLRNLKGGSLLIPKGRMVVVCGISGAGKSTLIRDLLLPNVQRAIASNSPNLAGNPDRDGFTALRGANGFRQVIEVDQSPIGKTPRSTPATYIGVFDRIREIFANAPEARMRGFDKSTFSFNTKGGRCESCKGAGRIKLEMTFMPDAYVPCEDCNGTRFGQELRDIHWHGKSIADVLNMSFAEAVQFFAFQPDLAAALQLMVDTGLDYLTLGQSSPSLSGGEAQRLKLVSELAKGLPSFRERKSGSVQPNLYLLEEPTIGLHLHDCQRLLQLLHQLVDLGHSVIVIEHHLDIIADADYLIEIGPDGGQAGGHILFQGLPHQLLDSTHSPTAPFLRSLLNPIFADSP